MAKEIEGYLKLQIPAGQANPAPFKITNSSRSS